MVLSVGLIGCYPPPYGGVAVHIERVFHRLRDEGCEVCVYCQPLPDRVIVPGLRPVSRGLVWQYWMLQYGWRCAEQIVHCHYGWPWSIAMLYMLQRGKRVVMTFHTEQTERGFRSHSPVVQAAARCLFRSPDVRWVAVSPVVRDQLMVLGAVAERISVIPAFIPPVEVETEKPQLPVQITRFVEGHHPILSTYGYRLWLDERQQDVYGFDLCLEVVQSLKPEFPDLGLIILLPQVSEPEYYAKLRQRLIEYGIEDDVLFHTQPLRSGYPLWAISDVFIRATNTDGDALSVREALSLSVPVVASDAAPRPSGVWLFPSRDRDALISTVRNAIYRGRKRRSESVHSPDADNLVALLEIYRHLMSPMLPFQQESGLMQ